MFVTILVKYKDSSDLVEYTTDIMSLVVTDENVDYICLQETGEVIYTCDYGFVREVQL